jgi:PAS domain-containing protein
MVRLPDTGQTLFLGDLLPLQDETNRVCGVVANSRDITELKIAEAALADSEARYRGIVETAEEGIWQVDADWCTVYVNRRMEALLACKPGEMLGRSLGDFMDTDAAAQLGRLQVERKAGVRETHDFHFPASRWQRTVCAGQRCADVRRPGGIYRRDRDGD